MSDLNRLHSVKNLPSRLSISRSKIYEEMASGRLRYVHIGSRRLVPEAAIADYIAELIAEEEAATSLDGDSA